MATVTRIRVDAKPLEGLADRLERAAQRGRFAASAADAVNAVTVRADKSLRDGETRNINLSAAYVKSKTDVRFARSGDRPQATILTSGDLTVMGNFSPLQMFPGRGAMRRAGPRVGMRNAGTAVAIKKSEVELQPQWFVLPLRRGTLAGGNGFGVFVRDDRLAPSPRALREGRAGKRHIYGPSPYQLFKAQITLQQDDIEADLRRTASDLMGRAIQGALE